MLPHRSQSLVVETRIVEAELLFQVEQFPRFFCSLQIRHHAAKLLRQNQNAAIGVEDLRLPVRFVQIVLPKLTVPWFFRIMRVGRFQKRSHRFGKPPDHREFHTERVGTSPMKTSTLGKNALRNRFTSRPRMPSREADGSERRLSRPVGPSHDRPDAAGLRWFASSLAGDLVAVHIDRMQMSFGLHKALCRSSSASKATSFSPMRYEMFAIVGRRKAFRVHTAADLDDPVFDVFGFGRVEQGMVVHRGYSCRKVNCVRISNVEIRMSKESRSPK